MPFPNLGIPLAGDEKDALGLGLHEVGRRQRREGAPRVAHDDDDGVVQIPDSLRELMPRLRDGKLLAEQAQNLVAGRRPDVELRVGA